MKVIALIVLIISVYLLLYFLYKLFSRKAKMGEIVPAVIDIFYSICVIVCVLYILGLK